jgi:hypothetical protein
MIRFLQQGGSVTPAEIKPLRELANLPTATKQQKFCRHFNVNSLLV